MAKPITLHGDGNRQLDEMRRTSATGDGLDAARCTFGSTAH